MKVEFELPKIIQATNTEACYWTLVLDGHANVAPGNIGLSMSPNSSVLDSSSFRALHAVSHVLLVVANGGWIPTIGHVLWPAK